VPDGFHPPLEEYLETIHALEEEGVPVIQARLVERLGHSAQSVSEMVHRLESEGYLERRRRGVALTQAGRLRAESDSSSRSWVYLGIGPTSKRAGGST
jgi:Mn-dependent DtxR family transcriptional regulator